MPSEYALHFRLRGRGPVNNLELKLVDATGRTSGDMCRRTCGPPERWKRLHDPQPRHRFCLGPVERQRLSELGSIEFAIVAGEGGRGRSGSRISRSRIATPAQAPTASASSAQPGFGAHRCPGRHGLEARAEDRRPWIIARFHAVRAISAVSIIDWLGGAPPGRFSGSRFEHRHSLEDSARRRPCGRHSQLRLSRRASRRDSCASICRVPRPGAILRMQSFEFSRSIDAFWYAVAERRGARLASALAASRTERMDADRHVRTERIAH